MLHFSSSLELRRAFTQKLEKHNCTPSFKASPDSQHHPCVIFARPLGAAPQYSKLAGGLFAGHGANQRMPLFQIMNGSPSLQSNMRFLAVSFIMYLFAPRALGFCTVPPKGAVTFCDINYPVYHLNKEELDSYWTVLDSAAEKLSRSHESLKCKLPDCKKYECGIFFLKCNGEGDAPLRTCR
jgi:hypothetical protein